MLIWIIILIIIAFSLISAEFSRITVEFIEQHVIALLLVGLALLYSLWRREKNRIDN
ncbi:MAG: hypothetical protein ACLFSQ_04190 [Candidatus Zixiibacteriota bacterium]